MNFKICSWNKNQVKNDKVADKVAFYTGLSSDENKEEITDVLSFLDDSFRQNIVGILEKQMNYISFSEGLDQWEICLYSIVNDNIKKERYVSESMIFNVRQVIHQLTNILSNEFVDTKYHIPQNYDWLVSRNNSLINIQMSMNDITCHFYLETTSDLPF